MAACALIETEYQVHFASTNRRYAAEPYRSAAGILFPFKLKRPVPYFGPAFHRCNCHRNIKTRLCFANTHNTLHVHVLLLRLK